MTHYETQVREALEALAANDVLGAGEALKAITSERVAESMRLGIKPEACAEQLVKAVA